MTRNLFLFAFILLFFYGCRSYQATTFDFPNPVDTTTKPITPQEKKVYQPVGQNVFAHNQFDGARLNDFQWVQKDTFRVTISPENQPINNSAYYAFKLWSTIPQSIILELNYTEGNHRYPPKISLDGENWQRMDSTKTRLASDSVNAYLQIPVSPDTLWVAAQELQTSTHIKQWCQQQAQSTSGVQYQVVGKSKLGREIPLLDICQGEPKGKDVIIILSRQHPPEVTGYFAMQAFVEEILADTRLSNDFRKKFRLLVFPLMNPDGVDLGHWRHNAGGIDLNRDWAYYHQPETRQVADFSAKTTRRNKSKVILGLDFHSTWYDIFYTNQQPAKNLPGFKDYWLFGIKTANAAFDIVESPSNVGAPVSKGWFLTQFEAEGITYEIGDETSRGLIREKGRISAIEMMELLIYK